MSLYPVNIEDSKKDKRISFIFSLSFFAAIICLLYFAGFKIPTPPLPSQLLYKDQEIELVPLESVIMDVGTGGGGSGTPTNAPKVNQTTPQTEEFITESGSNIFTNSGKSNHSNTDKTTNNTSSTTTQSTNYFGSGGTGGGNQGGRGSGFGNDDGNGTGPGNGPGSGGDVRRYLVERPNTSNFQSDENCIIKLRVQVDENGNIVGKPAFVKEASTTNNTTLVNQVIYAVQTQAKFNKAKGTKIISQVITIEIQAS